MLVAAQTQWLALAAGRRERRSRRPQVFIYRYEMHGFVIILCDLSALSQFGTVNLLTLNVLPSFLAADKHHIAITATVPAHLRQAAMHVAELGPVHHTLFVENLPPATNEAMLSVLFTQFPGAPA